MTVDLCIGISGAGKTHHLVKEKVLEAVTMGRRVVTNVDGIDQVKIYDFLVLKGFDAANFGDIVTFNLSDLNDNFFPKYRPSTDDFLLKYDDRESFLKSGDLVIFDEAHDFFPVKSRRNHMCEVLANFLPIHRHFSGGPLNLPMDFVFASQNYELIRRDIKLHTDFVFFIEPHESISSQRSYTFIPTKKASNGDIIKLDAIVKFYDPVVWTFYKSSNTVDAKKHVDKNKSIFSFKFKLGLVVVPTVLIATIYYVSTFFSGGMISKKPSPSTPAVSAQQVVSPSASLPNVASDSWRLIGMISNKQGLYVVLQNGQNIRYELAAGFVFVGNQPVSGLVDGHKVTVYSGGGK